MRNAACLTLCLCVFPLPLRAGDDKPASGVDPAKLLGSWEFVSTEKGGEKKGEEELRGQSVTITEKTMTLKGPAGEFVMEYTLDNKGTPTVVKLAVTESPFGPGGEASGILELKGDQLRFCYATEGAAPKAFDANGGNRLSVLKRSKGK